MPDKNILSHPVWVRGLKQGVCLRRYTLLFVAPRVGAWIETLVYDKDFILDYVAPRVGAWIETKEDALRQLSFMGRTPCGCVD